jgi:tyrosine-protein kinase Etk/Wzc
LREISRPLSGGEVHFVVEFTQHISREPGTLVPVHTDTSAQADSLLLEVNGREAQDPVTEVSLLDVAVLLVKRKRFIIRFVLAAIVLSIILALILPVSYEAQVVLLPPSGQSSSVASALLGQLGGLGSVGPLSAIAGGFGMKTPTDMYVSLLKSRTVEDATIQRFGLMSEYKTKRLSDARKVFERQANVVAGQKDGLIRVTVEDHDAKRAAELANGYVEEFKKLSASLAITEAARRRLFFEQQLEPAKEQLARAEEAMRKTQQETGVLQIDSQARALIESTAVLRAQVVAKEVQIQSMRSFATDDNPEIVLAKQQLAALQSQLEQIAGSQKDTGSDIVLSKGRITGSGLEYLRRYRDLKYNETVYELLTKELEIAKLDEAREGEIVQVVDTAVIPDKKASPHRTLIVIGATILAFLVAVSYVIVRRGLERTFSVPENRERLDAIKAYWRKRPERAN